MTDRRNPYLVLGLDFGADARAAQAAFARLTRRLRRGRSGGYGIEDATWALHEIEHAATDPQANLDLYRVPADPAAYDYQPVDGVLSLAPRNLPRQAGSARDELTGLRAQLVRELGGAALDALADELEGWLT
jgi:hypothetical protein